MPRRNNRKHYKGEGTLGFNPNKYIGKAGGARYSRPSPGIQRISMTGRPSADRHKAHSDTKKKRRAREQLRQIQKETEKFCAAQKEWPVRVSQSTHVKQPEPAPQIVPAPQSASASQSAPAPQSTQVSQPVPEPQSAPDQHNATSFFGGIAQWLRRKVRPV